MFSPEVIFLISYLLDRQTDTQPTWTMKWSVKITVLIKGVMLKGYFGIKTLLVG